VSWRVAIPGQPISVNHAHGNRTIALRDGSTIHTRGKTSDASTYQNTVTQLAKAARPARWIVPIGSYVRVRFWYFLNPAIDCDNVKKLVIDGLAAAIPTSDPRKMLNDRWVLTCDVAVVRVPKGEQRLELEIDLETTPHP
jgi:hypothetical protein